MSTVQVLDNPSQTIVISGNAGFVLGAGSAQLAFTPLKKSGSYVIKNTDNLVFADATGGPFTLTLPTAVGFTSIIMIIATTNSSNLITLTAQGGQKVAGVTSVTLGTSAANGLYRSVTLVSDNANWWIA